MGDKTIDKKLIQPTFATLIANKSNKCMKGKRLLMNVFINVKLQTEMEKGKARMFHFISANPEVQIGSISSETHSSASATIQTEDETTVNVNVTLNVTADTRVKGNFSPSNFC